MSFFDACGEFEADVFSLIETSALTIFVTSTQGNGELPSLSNKFFSQLFGERRHILSDKICAVLGFGSTAYPIFCGAAKILSDELYRCGASEIIARGECDAVAGEASTFHDWVSPNQYSSLFGAEGLNYLRFMPILHATLLYSFIRLRTWSRRLQRTATARSCRSSPKTSRGPPRQAYKCVGK